MKIIVKRFFFQIQQVLPMLWTYYNMYRTTAMLCITLISLEEIRDIIQSHLQWLRPSWRMYRTKLTWKMPSSEMWRCVSCINRSFGGTCRHHLQGRRDIRERGKLLDSLLATVWHFSSLTYSSVFTRPTRRHIPEDGILHSHRSEYLKSYIKLSTLVYNYQRSDESHLCRGRMWHYVTLPAAAIHGYGTNVYSVEEPVQSRAVGATARPCKG
jgi:hypothetical protein